MSRIDPTTKHLDVPTIDFFRWIFGDGVCAERRLSIFTLPNKMWHRFKSIDKGAAHAAASADQNCYFGVGLIKGSPRGRGKLEDVCAIGCLWADIDFAGTGHKKPGLIPSYKEAVKLLQKIGLEPSVMVSSGNGLHVYWLLDELWLLDAEGERADAARLAKQWVTTVQAIGRAEGYEIDAVGDLPRVLRVPNTFNQKADPPIPVGVVAAYPELRYTRADFDMYLVAPEYEETKENPVVASVGAIALNVAAAPPMSKFAAMMENDAGFAASWNRKQDFSDQSPSAYDMSLATLAASSGWADQEIADLIMASRREHGEDVKKAMRRDYIQRTIGKARTATQADQAMDKLVDAARNIPETGKPTQTGTIGAEGRQELLEQLSKALKLHVVNYVQIGRQHARYKLILKDGTDILLGTYKGILNHGEFRGKIYEATGLVIPTMKASKWLHVCRVLGSIAEVVENIEATRKYLVLEWLHDYLDNQTIYKGEEWMLALTHSEPFIKEQRIYVHVGSFRKHVKLVLFELNVTRGDLYEQFHLVGFTRKTVNATARGQNTTRSYWWAPLETIWPENGDREQPHLPGIDDTDEEVIPI